MTSPFYSDNRDGDIVQCQRCAKNVRVKYFDKDTVVIVSTQEQQTLALRCQYCGYVMCDSCAHPAESLFPVCPACQREWGPYYFTHDIATPSLSKTPLVSETPLPAKPPSLPEPETTNIPSPAQEVPAQTNETLAAGEVDIFREELNQKNKHIFRKVLLIVLIFLLVGLVSFTVLGRGGSWLRKGLRLLSARPTRTSTAILLLDENTALATPLKTTSPSVKISPTYRKPSSTPMATIASQPTSKVGTTSTPVEKSATATIKIIPTSTNTFTPTHTNTPVAQGDCVPALSITLDDLGKKLCVTGIVAFTTLKGNSFSIYFSEDESAFRIIVYDRVPKGIEKGVCVKVTGVIKQILSSPVIAPGYKDEIEICSQ